MGLKLIARNRPTQISKEQAPSQKASMRQGPEETWECEIRPGLFREKEGTKGVQSSHVQKRSRFGTRSWISDESNKNAVHRGFK